MERVPVSWWFGLEAIVLGGALALVGVTVLVIAIVWHGRGRRLLAVVGGVCVLVVSAMTIVDSPRLLRDLDFRLNQDRREAVVAAVQRDVLSHVDVYGTERLPGSFADLSMDGEIDVDQGAGWVFFTRVVGFSPDPYCGYEFVADPTLLETDPLGSGHGIAESLGDGWYWICAS